MSRQVESLRHFVNGFGRMPNPPRALANQNMVVVGSGKGGVGTSSVTALMGLQLARAGRSVLLVDANDGALHLLFGLNGSPGLEALGARDARPESLLVDVQERLTLLPGGPHDGGHAATGRMERMGLLRKVATLYDKFDLVLVDGGARISSVLEACAAGANRLIAVTGADRLSTAATYALLKGIGGRLPGLALEVLVNRETAEAAIRVDRHLRQALAHFHTGSVAFTGVVPSDPTVHGGPDRSGALQDVPYDAPAAQAALEIGLRLDAETRLRPEDIRAAWLKRTGS